MQTALPPPPPPRPPPMARQPQEATPRPSVPELPLPPPWLPPPSVGGEEAAVTAVPHRPLTPRSRLTSLGPRKSVNSRYFSGINPTDSYVGNEDIQNVVT